MIDVANEESCSILKLDLNRLSAIIDRFIEGYRNGNVKIDIEHFRVNIGFESDIKNELLDEFQLNEDNFERITSDILFFIVALIMNEEEVILKKYGKKDKTEKILNLLKQQFWKYPSLKKDLRFRYTCAETSKIPTIYLRKDYISEIRNSLLRIIEEIKDNFEDFRDRQIGLFKFRKTLESAREESQGNPVLLELMICLFDTLKNLYSENLTIEHIDILEEIIYYIDSGITEGDVDRATERLISAGLNPLPKLDGLAEIYKRQGEI